VHAVLRVDLEAFAAVLVLHELIDVHSVMLTGAIASFSVRFARLIFS
jgi:hypothetical protein